MGVRIGPKWRPSASHNSQSIRHCIIVKIGVVIAIDNQPVTQLIDIEENIENNGVLGAPRTPRWLQAIKVQTGVIAI
ncbi:MAG: hypothetical protein R3A44_02490 [Caldilineaceae bacterium]